MAVNLNGSATLPGWIAGGRGAAWAQAQHARGRLTARERVELLLDEGSCTELGALAAGDEAQGGDGVVTVQGRIGGRAVCVFAKDMSVGQGTLAGLHARRICRLQEFALQSRIPIIGMFDSAGLRLEAGMSALEGYGAIVRNTVAASGIVPQISLVLGGCAGADALLPPLSDFVFMANDDSSLFVSGPEVVKRVTGEAMDASMLGGPEVHTRRSSIADGVCANDVLAILQVRRLFGFLPANQHAGMPRWSCLDDETREAPALDTLRPASASAPYDMKELVRQVSDEGDFLELQPDFAANVITGLARLGGRTVGVVANQPSVLAGVLDGNATRKAARLVRFCNAFGIAVVTFVDVPGFLPGAAEEHGGLARHASELLAAYASASVPLVTVVVRDALGAAGVSMGSLAIGADLVYAWPDAQIGLLGAKGAAALRSANGRALDAHDYAQRVLAPGAVAQLGAIDDVIVPRQTRPRIVQALKGLANKSCGWPWHEHPNYPL
ncbi:carboxyl transferase domain-containing protein [Variovorax humicola]|uniref:Carboxyl transferase domain-containing protein n=1 Tax=Variovorax humicola TaxID=1769758 RepID=A0ABU8WA60_9BURK